MNKSVVGVIEYKAGNAPSVLNALRHLDIPCALISDKSDIDKADALILPGVGSAAATMASLAELDLTETLNRKVNQEGTPFLGICIGLQILFSHSDEGDTDCLGWISGQVRRFPQQVRIPQMGWNRVDFRNGRPADHFYFVNSYYAVPEENSAVAATADYGVTFCAMINRQNITATQFHLEKSGAAGLNLLKEWWNQC